MPLLCLVPSALRASRATRRLCDAGEGVLFGRQATTFDALAGALVAASGDRRPVLGPLGERLLAVEAGRAAGGPFGDLAAGDGLAASLWGALSELRRGEVSAADASAAAAELEGAPRERLGRLAAALAAWERRLDELGLLDRAGAVRAAAVAARGRVTVQETEAPSLLLLDGFSALSPGEWDLFVAVAARARAVRVRLPHLADLPGATAAAEPLARRVESLHELAAARSVELELDRADDPARAARIRALLAAMAGGSPAAAGGPGTVQAACAGGEEDEARALAALAAAWVAAGMDPAEIRLFSPSPVADAPRLARAFAGVGLPLWSGRGPPVAGLPIVATLREALGAAGGLGRRAAERLARSGYLHLGEPVERMPALLDRAGAVDGRMGPAEALRRRGASLGDGGGRERAGIGRATGRLVALAALLAPLDGGGTARRHAARLAAFVEAAGIRRRAARAERPIASRDLAALARVEAAAEEVARTLAHLGWAEEPLSREGWLSLLDAALSGATLPDAGEPFGGAVELLSLDDAPGESARGVLVAGCGRGAFPPAPPPEPLLREPERLALNARLRRAAVATSGARRAEARHRAICAAAAAREAIAFTWCADAGPVAPLVEEGLAGIGEAIPDGPAAPPGLESARSAREALRAAVRRTRGGAAVPLGGDAGARLASALERGRVEEERREALDRREPSPHAGEIPARELEALLPEEWAPTHLEDYARCPYRLFLSLAVRLPSREAGGVEIDLRDEGSLLHAVLEAFVRGRVGRGAWPPDGGAADREEALRVAEELFARFEGAGRTGDPAVWAARRRAVRARLLRWVEAEARDADGLVPQLVEHAFGGRSGRPPLRFAAGGVEVAVKGRIDRVDADGRRLRVLDYKNARADRKRRELLAPDAFGVTSFQIPVYLAAAARDLPGRESLAATIGLLRDGERLKPFEGSAADLASGPLGEPLSSAVVGAVERVRAGRFPIASRDCDRCDYGAVCRAQGVAESEEADG